jgi:multisubunit Na+/H+ antiporter MnhC subunit
MTNIYAPLMRALVVVALVLATATLMFVAVNTARADAPSFTHIHPNS